jgi:hypothetical protein
MEVKAGKTPETKKKGELNADQDEREGWISSGPIQAVVRDERCANKETSQIRAPQCSNCALGCDKDWPTLVLRATSMRETHRAGIGL